MYGGNGRFPEGQRGGRGGRGRGDRGGGRGRGGYRGGGRGGFGAQAQRGDNGEGNQAGERRAPFMGYRRLKEFEAKEAHDMTLSLLSTRSGFRELLKANAMNADWVALLLGILQKACTQRGYPKQQSELLNILRTSSFLTIVIPQYISAMTIEPSLERQMSFQKPLCDLLDILKEMLTRMPNSYLSLLGVVAQLESVIKILSSISTIVTPELESELVLVLSLRDDLAERLRTNAKVADGEEAGLDITPPDDFRDKSIFPKLEDINDEKPFIRASRVKGKYPDVETYLDIQFRLLREDFVRPLREGIGEYLDVKTRGQSVRRIQSVRVYQGVHILYPVCTHSGTAYRIKFDASKFTRMRWESSRRLIFGSLLCLSNDEFQSLLFATVTDRKPKDLEKGELEVRFENYDFDRANITANNAFTMVETSAYFEAYRHVLKALQSTNENSFPFQKYIISCEVENVMKPPAYLLHRGGGVTYDLTTLLKDGTNLAEAKSIPVLTTTRWPRLEHLHFDESQLEAVKTALTKEFVIIQGPPGTGKTYIGLKIVEVLLRNKSFWHGTGDNHTGKSPIFIVCYTNHALDQFLEGIHEFHKEGIVRVGGRSSSTVLEKCVLKNLREVIKKDRATPSEIFQGLRDTRSEMAALRETIEKTTADIEATSKGIIKDSFLEDIIGDDLFDMLHMAMVPQQSSSVLADWLGLGGGMYQSGGVGMVAVDNVAGVEGEEENEDEEERDSGDELVIEDEAEMRAQQQLDFLDEDDFTPLQRQQLRQRMNRERAEEALAVNIDAVNMQPVVDNDGWQIQDNSKNRKKRMKQGLNSTDAMDEEEVGRVFDIWALALNDRWRLYRYWINLYIDQLRGHIRTMERRYDDAAARVQEIKMQEDVHIMKNATILGMTTTGAARYRAALQQIKPKIVIVEEAAEVLEAHIVTTLSEGCQHLILIGDHKQLRPSANVYELATKYNLEISLFERMVHNNVTYNCLQLQHRMRPSIAKLMEPIYPELKNHDSVYNFDNVKGVSTNMFFIDHVQAESHNDELKSKSNKHEARYMVALCRYLILQGYEPRQITMLTLYSGQLFLIRDMMKPIRDFFKGIRLTAVDNFQGEENDIILLSLVRSNPEGSIGFLSIENRVCVALSRARKGLYVIGNFDMLQSSSKTTLWRQLVNKVSKENLTGKELHLYCQNHPEHEILAKTAEDFNKAPEGGCTEPCTVRLQCGHVCPRTCHHDDIDHVKIKCMKTCDKVICEDGHKCKKKCHQACGPCNTLVIKQVPSCGHEQRMKCHESPFQFRCQQPCQKTLPQCGHQCKNVCGDACQVNCIKIEPRHWPCGHVVMMECYKKPDSHPCTNPCGETIQCGHVCSGKCGYCRQGRLHIPCKFNCGRTLVCGHACEEPCTSDCPPCLKKCENRCNHSKCTKQCGKPCVPCKEPCEWQCRHHKCTMLCSEPCNRPRCNEPCRKLLACGHPCIGICGEVCPTKCRICNKEEVTETFLGHEDEDDALFVQLEDCSHLFEVRDLDRWIDSAEDTSSSIKMKTCPKCTTPIRRNRRYGTTMNEILNKIEKVKRLVIGEQNNIDNEIFSLLREIGHTNAGRAFSDLRSALDSKHTTVTTETIVIVKNQLRFVKKIEAIKLKISKEIFEEDSVGEPLLERLRNVMRTREQRQGAASTENINTAEALKGELDVLQKWITRPRNHLSEQETGDFNTELVRMSLNVSFYILRLRQKKQNSREVEPLLEKVERLFKDGKKFDDNSENYVKALLEKIQTHLGGLGITEKERVEIVQAIGLSQGHWFQCPNGHVYAIGECGGATEEGICPECKAKIGGLDHTLDRNNRVATNMDGAQYAAWSEQANLENYNLDHFND